MENIPKPIIVPCDYSRVSEYAFEHAVLISKVINQDIVLLHIVSGKKEVNLEKEKLQKKCDELILSYGIKVFPRVMTGNIFDSIKEAALEYNAEVVVMGTHGIKGAQKFFGSYALKVIANSKVPFVVVQEKPTDTAYKTIVFPIDFRLETKEKVAWANFMAKHFQSKFLVYRRKSRDRGFKRNIASNLHYFESFFKNNNIPFELHSASGRRSFEKETVEFAKKMNADLILVLTTRNISFIDYLLGANEQYIIANPEKITVMCINPKPPKISSGFSASGG